VSASTPYRLRIEHLTGFIYTGEVMASYNEARMTPLTTTSQTTLEARVDVGPHANTYRYWDYWGSLVTAFDVRVPHDRLTVTASSVVETGATLVTPPPAGWDVLRSAGCRDEFAEYLITTPRADPGEEAIALAREIAPGRDPDRTAVAVAEWLGDQLEYVPGATGVHTSARQAWDVRKGVCQDFAHVVVGVLRALGIPARYVSGYLHPSRDAAVGQVVRGESHAWVEWWAGDWRAFDPTNGRPADAEHVVVARGRDYADVPPLKGLYSGPPGELFVTVEVTRLA
jgi:transglutaminase-like putative cysteine protease